MTANEQRVSFLGCGKVLELDREDGCTHLVNTIKPHKLYILKW